MITQTEAMLVAKCIRNTVMAPTTKERFVKELVKIIKLNSPWFKDKTFTKLALLGTAPDGGTQYHMDNMEKRLDEV